VLQAKDGAFIVMEYVDAPTLSELVKKEGPLSDDRAARVGLEVLDALEVAHAKGIVHRDVKPGNVMVVDGGAKLADFGIASVKDDPKITSTGMVLGSPQFMAPEQARGSGSDSRTDLWSLGATLYYAIEGDLPFNRGQPIATLSAVINEEPHPMRSNGPLTPVVSVLLSKTPEQRPSGRALRSMLEKVASGSTPVSAAEPHSGPGTRRVEKPVTPRPRPAPVPESPAPTGRNRRVRAVWPLLAVLLVIAAVGAVIAFFLTYATDDEPRAPAAQNRTRQSEERDSSGGNGGGGESNEGEGGPGETTEQSGPPSGWTTYTDPETGFEIEYPQEWQIEQDPTDPSSTDFQDASTGTYLRVDWTDAPGDDPVEAWENFAEDFGDRHANYREIQIEPATFKGYKAGVWEFTYTDGGADLHAVDLGFVTKNMGFALFFQSHEEDWSASQDLWEQLQDSFRPPRGE
jgi:serine/threonine protein kinase